MVPVAHIWYFRSLPNKIGYLWAPTKKLDMIIYYERYVVIQAGKATKEDGSELEFMEFLTEEEYLEILLDHLPQENNYLEDSDPTKFIAKMGAEALVGLLSRLNLESLSNELRHKAATETSQQRKQEALKRLQVVEAMKVRSTNKPEWMIMKIVPVHSTELRPLVPLDGGRFATSDLNDLYRRVIIRNNRLKRLLEIKAPEVILRNEKRMLQESVDSLFDNTRKSSAVKTESNRPLKSLSDSLKGKQGRFRQNLLGKRVDYSARSVIVVGPEMPLHECGLPKNMAAELYKPFIIRKLIERGIVKTVKSAKKDHRQERSRGMGHSGKCHEGPSRAAKPGSDFAPIGYSGISAKDDRRKGHSAASAGLYGLQRRLRRRPNGGSLAAWSRCSTRGSSTHAGFAQHPESGQWITNCSTFSGHGLGIVLHD